MEQFVQVIIDSLTSIGVPEAVIAALGVIAGWLLKAATMRKPKPEPIDETEIDQTE